MAGRAFAVVALFFALLFLGECADDANVRKHHHKGQKRHHRHHHRGRVFRDEAGVDGDESDGVDSDDSEGPEAREADLSEVPRAAVQQNLRAKAQVHPSIQRAMDKKDSSKRDLDSAKDDVTSASSAVAATRAKAIEHMNEANEIKSIERKAAETALARKVHIEHLEGQKRRVKETHDALQKKLDAIMTPKIQKEEHKLEVARNLRMQAEEAEKDWEAKVSHSKAEAEQALAEKKARYQQLKEAIEKVERARKEREDADKAYRAARLTYAGKEEAYRYNTAKLEGARTHTKDKKQDEVDTMSALQTLKDIKAAESERIDRAAEQASARLDARIQHWQASKQEAERTEAKQQAAFKSWQEKERARAARAAAAEADYKGKLDNYEDKRRDFNRSIRSIVGKEAEAKSRWEWDDWAWPMSKTAAAEAGLGPVKISGDFKVTG